MQYAISLVTASLEKDDGNPYFSRWKESEFSGSETFCEVVSALSDKMVCVGHYIKYIRKIPFIRHLVSVKSNVDGTKLLISINMSLRCFEKLLVDEHHEVQQATSTDVVTAEEAIWNENVDLLENKQTLPKDKIDLSVEQNNLLGNLDTPTTYPNETDLVSKEEVIQWKAGFYQKYQSKFATLSNTTLLSTMKYNSLVQDLQYVARERNQKLWTDEQKRYNKKFILIGNIQYRMLNRKNKHGNPDLDKLVATYEEVFDIMLFHHRRLSHTRDVRKNKIELDKVWWSIPESCLKLFLKMCPYCFPARNPSAGDKMQPLKFIFSPTVGHRAQIDLIGMESQSINGYEHILRYVDHLSGFSHVAVLRTKEAEEVGAKLIQIFSTAIIPEILQSDNGSEFLGECIAMLDLYYPDIHIVKGKPRKPSTQGKVERGHASFKENLQKWMDSTGNKNWLVGAYIVNAQMNQIPNENRGGFSPYNLYYGKDNNQKNIINFGQVVAKSAKTEYGIICGKTFCIEAAKLDSDRVVLEIELIAVIKKGMYCIDNCNGAPYTHYANKKLCFPKYEFKVMNFMKMSIMEDYHKPVPLKDYLGK